MTKEEYLKQFDIQEVKLENYSLEACYPPRTVKILRERQALRKEYEAKFGEGSLDQVVLAVYEGEASLPAFEEENRDLRRAIDNNEPYPQIPFDDLLQIIF